MKTLTLLRHAKSDQGDPGLRDFDRPLNAKGQRAAEAMGRRLRGAGFDHVIASPAARVETTLDRFAAGLGETLAPAFDRRVYLASAVTLLELVRAADPAHDRVLLVGHNPGLEDLVLMLVPDRAGDDLRDAVEAKFPTASVAVMEFDGEWADLREGGARLARFVRPRDVDPAFGPDD